MQSWDEIRTAYYVAKYGTVSGTAEALGMHRATIIRHIDNLEAELGCKLFQRHSKGYTMTEMGHDLLRTSDIVEQEFLQLKTRAQGSDELAGDFIVTSLEFIAPLLLPVLQAFERQHPKLQIRYLTSQDLFKLEHGQAHIAIRTGVQPEHPDYVVKPFTSLHMGLFAHQDYVSEFGLPVTMDELAKHRFITTQDDAPKPAAYRWINEHINPQHVVLKSNSMAVQIHAIKAGLGIGAMFEHEASQDASLVPIQLLDELSSEVEVKNGEGDDRQDHKPSKVAHQSLPNPSWQVQNWLITHGDLHRSDKVQAFLTLLSPPKKNHEFSNTQS